MEVGQGDQGEELRGVLGQPAIPDLALAPQMLDDAEGMFDPRSGAVALAVELTVRAVEPPAPPGLVKHPPFHVVCYGLLLASLVRVEGWAAMYLQKNPWNDYRSLPKPEYVCGREVSP